MRKKLRIRRHIRAIPEHILVNSARDDPTEINFVENHRFNRSSQLIDATRRNQKSR